MFEIYLSIIVFAFQTSNWVELREMDPPWLPYKSSNRVDLSPLVSPILHWVCTLQENDRQWEASRILRILLPVLPMLPSAEVVEVLFLERNDGQERLKRATGPVVESELDKLDESDSWACFAMNLSKAQYLLDTIIREYNTSPKLSFGREILFARGRDYLNMAETI
jgi:hypothetical protein